jgi:orotate phosphoribosyltransferase
MVESNDSFCKQSSGFVYSMSEIQHPEMLRQELLLLIAERAFVRNLLALPPQKGSGVFVDTKFVTLHPRGASIIGRFLLGRLRELGLQSVGGVSVGGIPIVSAIVALSDQEDWPITGFFVRKGSEYAEFSKEIEGNLEPGTAVGFVEDVISGGKSTLAALRSVEAAGCKVARVFVVVDREEGGPENLQNSGYEVEALVRLSQIRHSSEDG